MKLKALIVLFASLHLGSCGEGRKKQVVVKVPEVSVGESVDGVPNPVFERTQFEFGHLISGEKVTWSFRFQNKGNAPLIIYNVSSGCGCTVADYPKDPVLPGHSGRVKVDFNSAGRQGRQIQTVRVFTNADPPIHQLTVTADVR